MKKPPSASTALLQGSLDVLILKVLAIEPLHGLGVSRRIAQVTGNTFQVKPGSPFSSTASHGGGRLAEFQLGNRRTRAEPSFTGSPRLELAS